MQTKDHLALGHYFLDTTGYAELHRYKTPFLLGCVEPDYNIITYMRGLRTHRKFRGHNAENSFSHIEKCLTAFQTNGMHSAWSYFTLGTMLHYTADAFTWPHNDFWEQDLMQHIIYEAKLHEHFSMLLQSKRFGTRGAEESPVAYFKESHNAYSGEKHGINTDCGYIIDVCREVLDGSLQYICDSGKKVLLREEGKWNESAYYHGLV